MSDFVVFFDTGSLPHEKFSELEECLPRDAILRIKDTKNDRERRLRTGAYFALDILFRHLYCRSMPDIRRNESGKPYFVKGESSSFDCEKVDCAASFSPEKSDCSASPSNSSLPLGNGLNLGGNGILPSFSISHSGDIAAVIISTDGRDIGIDIEGASSEKSADRAAAKFLGRFEKFSDELKRSYERGSFTGEPCGSFPYNHSGMGEAENSEIEKSCTAGSSVIGSFAHTEQKLSDKSSVLCEYVKADSDRDREVQASEPGFGISFFELRQEGSEFELYPCQLKRLFYPDFEDSNLVKWTVLEALLKMSGGGFCDLGKLENSLKRASLATFKLSAGDEFTVSVAKAEN